LIPWRVAARGLAEGGAHYAFDFALQLPEVPNAPLTLQCCLLADGLRGSLAVDEPRPAVIRAVQTRWLALASAPRFPHRLRAVDTLPGKSGHSKVMDRFMALM